MNPSEKLWNFLLETSKGKKFRKEEAIKKAKKISEEFLKKWQESSDMQLCTINPEMKNL